MTVKELCETIDVESHGDLEVIVRCRWQGEAPAHNLFDIAYVSEELEPDTGHDVVMLECQQQGMPAAGAENQKIDA